MWHLSVIKKENEQQRRVESCSQSAYRLLTREPERERGGRSMQDINKRYKSIWLHKKIKNITYSQYTFVRTTEKIHPTAVRFYDFRASDLHLCLHYSGYKMYIY